MVTVRAVPEHVTLEPQHTAVIVVDMQNDFGSKGGMFDRAGIPLDGIRATVEPTTRVLAAARRSGMKVIYLKMQFRADLSDAGGPNSPNRVMHRRLGLIDPPRGTEGQILVEGTWNTEIIQELTPEPGDIVVAKHRFSGFYGTDLDVILRGLGVSHLVFTGCTTSVCVESTVRDAAFRDYTCLVLSDCVAEVIGGELERTNHEASLLVMQVAFGAVSDSAALLEALEPQKVVAIQAPLT
jgi:ureidoacrylate peracid hydrolase